jgi:hypothetical protein
VCFGAADQNTCVGGTGHDDYCWCSS